MGQPNSKQNAARFHDFIRTKYDSMRNQNEYLVLSDIIQLGTSETIPITLSDLSVLYRLNRSHSGQFQCSELIEFSDFCHDQPTLQHIQAFCIKNLHEEVLQDDPSAQSVRKWVLEMLQQDASAKRASKTLDRKSIELLYESLHAFITVGIEEFHTLFDASIEERLDQFLTTLFISFTKTLHHTFPESSYCPKQ